MTLLSVNQLLVQLDNTTNQVSITVPITCKGAATTALVRLYIFEGSVLPTHGSLLASYEQTVSFDSGETRQVVFTHEETERSEKRRDVGVEVVVNGKIVASHEFDDVYTWPFESNVSDLIGPVIVIVMLMMMMGMFMPMLQQE